MRKPLKLSHRRPLLRIDEIHEYLRLPTQAVEELVGRGKLKVKVLFAQEWVERDSVELVVREHRG